MARPAHVRTAVERILEASDRHGWSVDGIAAALNAAGVEASFSAVWRALQHLERAGVATRVDHSIRWPGGPRDSSCAVSVARHHPRVDNVRGLERASRTKQGSQTDT